MIAPPQPPLERFAARLMRRSRFDDRDRAAFLALPAQPAQIRAHADFVRLGEHVDHACLVVDGLVARFGQNERGDRQIMAVHIPGDMPDLHSVVMSNTGSGLHALAATTLLRIPHEAIRDLTRSRPAVAEAFWRECVVDAAVLAEWVLNVGRRRALARTAHLLCEMAWRYGAAGTDRAFQFPITQEHLADMLALTAVHVNRTLKSLREDRVARTGRSMVQILDWDRLVEIGEFDPAYLEAGRELEPEASAACAA